MIYRELFIANGLSRYFTWSYNVLFVEDLLNKYTCCRHHRHLTMNNNNNSTNNNTNNSTNSNKKMMRSSNGSSKKIKTHSHSNSNNNSVSNVNKNQSQQQPSSSLLLHTNDNVNGNSKDTAVVEMCLAGEIGDDEEAYDVPDLDDEDEDDDEEEEEEEQDGEKEECGCDLLGENEDHHHLSPSNPIIPNTNITTSNNNNKPLKENWAHHHVHHTHCDFTVSHTNHITSHCIIIFLIVSLLSCAFYCRSIYQPKIPSFQQWMYIDIYYTNNAKGF